MCELRVGVGFGFETSTTVPVGLPCGCVGFVKGAVAEWVDEGFGPTVSEAFGLSETEGETNGETKGETAGDTDGETAGAPEVDGCGDVFWVRGTTTTGVPPESGVTMNCEPGLSLTAVCGTIALDPITTTLAVAAVVTPTRRPPTITVFEVAPASAAGRWNAASFTGFTSPGPFGATPSYAGLLYTQSA